MTSRINGMLMLGRALVVIEHLEEYPSRWLVAEYLEAFREAARSNLQLLITGVIDPRLQAILNSLRVGWVREHSWELYDIPGTIILDMWAARDLTPVEAINANVFIIGGIMGDYPPRGRGRLLSSHFDWASIRRLGDRQMSIHTSTWALARIRDGVDVSQLPLCSEDASIVLDNGLMEFEVRLPFAYPCDIHGRPRVPQRILELLSRGVVWEEEFLMV